MRELSLEEIGTLERLIQARLHGTSLTLFVRQEATGLQDNSGLARTGFISPRILSGAEQAVVDKVREFGKS